MSNNSRSGGSGRGGSDNNRDSRSNRGAGQGRGRGDGRPAGGGRGGASSSGGRSGAPSSGGRSGGPSSGGRSSGPSGSGKSWSGKPSGGGKGREGGRRDDRPGRKNDWKRPAGDDRPRTEEQARYDGPPIPEEITGKELDRNVAQQLRGLPEKLANRVARHLVAAGLVIDSDPRTAYEHTLAARARAARLAVVREACGEAAYAAGEYAEALSELRAAKRMNGVTAYLPIMADCERALGRPERALELAKSPAVAKFASPAKAEMTLVESGARRDMGQLDAALRTLENAPLQSQTREAWVVRLRYAYADTLLEAGRHEDALTWFHRTEAIDGDEITDAGVRAAEVERLIG